MTKVRKRTPFEDACNQPDVYKETYSVSSYDIYVLVCRLTSQTPTNKTGLWKPHWDQLKRDKFTRECLACGSHGQHKDDCEFDLANLEKKHVSR